MVLSQLRINVVICTAGQRQSLMERTLKSLAETKRPDGFEQVWVVQNGPGQDHQALCERLSDRLSIQFVRLNEKGKSRALGFALNEIGSGLVVFTDDDVRVNEDFLNAYAQAAKEHGPESFFGGPVRIDYEAQPPTWLLEYLPPSAVGWSLEDPATVIDKPCFLGANYGGFVETLLRVGGFKAHLGTGSRGNPVGEEFEIQDRLLTAGCRGVYLPEALVWHYVPRQRCTARWTLERMYRIWLTNGLHGDDPVPTGVTWRGLPRWMWRRAAGLGLKALAANLVPNPRRRFEIKKPYYQWRGYMEGLRLRMTQDQTPDTHPK